MNANMIKWEGLSFLRIIDIPIIDGGVMSVNLEHILKKIRIPLKNPHFPTKSRQKSVEVELSLLTGLVEGRIIMKEGFLLCGNLFHYEHIPILRHMVMTALAVPYPRPKQFSDPHHDFDEVYLKELLAIPDDKLGWSEFQNIFSVGLPAGTYSECCYFIPVAFQYIKENSEDALDCVSDLLWFISHHVEDLKKDDLLDACIEQIKDCLTYWTKEFDVVHHDADACQKKGWGLEYYDTVKNNQLVTEALDDLARFQSLKFVATNFLEELRASTDPLKAAWTLELHHVHVKYHFIEDAQLSRLISNKKALKASAQIVLDSGYTNKTTSPTYWNDVLDKLGTTA